MKVDPRLIELAIKQFPGVIDALKALFRKNNPTAPQPTSEEVIAAYSSAIISSLTKDAAWLAANPEP